MHDVKTSRPRDFAASGPTDSELTTFGGAGIELVLTDEFYLNRAKITAVLMEPKEL